MIKQTKQKQGYGQLYGTRQTPQDQAVPGVAQVKNSAGGYTFELDKWGRLERFLVLGTDTPTYYATARALTQKAAEAVNACLAEDVVRTIEMILSVSEAGRAPRNDPALFALAMAMSHESVDARRMAAGILPRVARTATHLFQFVEMIKSLRGRGTVLHRALQNWYRRPVKEVAYQAVKYQQRGGWSHRDVLRLAKPTPDSSDQDALFHWIVKGEFPETMTERPASLDLIAAYERAKTADALEATHLILAHGLTWEMLPTPLLSDPDVWSALLVGMPMTAMIRNLGRMTANGALTHGGVEAKLVIERLRTPDYLRKARVHPLSILVALNTYKSGKGVKGGLTWTPIPAIVDALDEAFYGSFGAVEPTGKRLLLALDVSASMTWHELAGMTGITPRVGSAAMAMVTMAADPNSRVVGFTGDRAHGGLTPLDISPRRRLDDVIRTIGDLPFGGTDCSLPMLHALEKGWDVDGFVVYTDNETWAGKIHPFQALRQYRERTGINAKMVVVGMTATEFSIADPSDAGMLDVVGFDTTAPQVISNFLRA